MFTSIWTPCVPGETTAQPNVETVLRPSVSDGPHRLEHEKFDPLVVRFEKSPEVIIMGVMQVDYFRTSKCNRKLISYIRNGASDHFEK